MTNISQHFRLPLCISSIGLIVLAITWQLGDGGLFLLFCFGAWIIGSEYACRFLAGTVISPYLFMIFSPLLLMNYSSVGDFRIRLACFFMLTYILFLAWRRPVRPGTISLAKIKPWQVWLFSFLIFALAAVALHIQGIQLSGDEPHYVMIAQSLSEDGDFDLKNNLENKTYFSYLPVEIRFHGSVYSGKYHSFHLPGVAFILLPFFYLFRLLGGLLPGSLYFRLVAALINSFFALGLFMALRAALPKTDNARLFLFFLLTFPLVFQAVHLFPELPAATLIIFAYIFGCDKQQYFLSGLLLAFIPWLHLKYSIPALILALFLINRIWRESPGNGSPLKRLLFLLTAPALSLTLLGFYSKFLYGSFNPSVISPEKNFFAIPLNFRIETLLSFFLDQRDGLLVYAPIFLLIFLVFKKEIRTSIRDFSLLASLLISYILFHAFTTLRGGYSPAARPTLFVMWIMAIFLTAYYRRAGEIGKTLFRFLAGLTCFATIWLFYYPFFLYQPVTREVSQRASSLLLFLGSAAVNLSSVFPSFLKKPNAAYLPNWIWLAVLAILIGLFYAREPGRALAKTSRIIFPALCLLLLFAVCFIPHVQLQTRYSAKGLAFYCNSKNFSYQKEINRFKILAGQDYDLFFDLNGSASEWLALRLLNNNKISLKIKNGKQTLIAENQAAESQINISLRALNKFSLGGKKLVHLGLESKAFPGTAFFWLQFH
jgi:hypothetical protein